MDATKITIKSEDIEKVNFNKIRARPKYNNKGEIRKMKLLIDLNKEETSAFKAVSENLKPEGVDLNSFVKSMFIVGVNTYIDQLRTAKEAVDKKESVEAENPSVEIITPEN